VPRRIIHLKSIVCSFWDCAKLWKYVAGCGKLWENVERSGDMWIGRKCCNMKGKENI